MRGCPEICPEAMALTTAFLFSGKRLTLRFHVLYRVFRASRADARFSAAWPQRRLFMASFDRIDRISAEVARELDHILRDEDVYKRQVRSLP